MSENSVSHSIEEDERANGKSRDEQPEVIFFDEEAMDSIQIEEENDDELLEDDYSVIKITSHREDVFCMSLSPSSQWLATGSQDDTAAVWDLNVEPLEERLRIVERHVDSVHCLAWNCSGNLLASGDMAGRIVCTSIEDSVTMNGPISLMIEDCQADEQIHYEEEGRRGDEEEGNIDNFEHIRWLLWHPSAQGILFAGSGDGSIWMWLIGASKSTDLSTSLCVQQFKMFPSASNSPCVSGHFLEGAKHLLCAYENLTAKIWDLKSATSISEIQIPSACNGAIDLHRNGCVAAFGCANGFTALASINLPDQRLKLVHVFASSPEKKKESISGFSGAKEDSQEEEGSSVECVRFAPDGLSWIAVGKANGQLSIFDWEHPSVRYEFEHDGTAVIDCIWRIGLTSKPVSAVPISLISITVGGAVRIYNARNGQILTEMAGGGDEVYCATLLENKADGTARLFTGCAGGLLRIFEIPSNL